MKTSTFLQSSARMSVGKVMEVNFKFKFLNFHLFSIFYDSWNFKPIPVRNFPTSVFIRSLKTFNLKCFAENIFPKSSCFYSQNFFFTYLHCRSWKSQGFQLFFKHSFSAIPSLRSSKLIVLLTAIVQQISCSSRKSLIYAPKSINKSTCFRAMQ